MQAKAQRFPKTMDVEKAGRPLRVAVVYSRLPLPMRRADQITVAHLLSFPKARGHLVDLFSVSSGGEADDCDFEWLRDHCREVHIYEHDLLSLSRGLSLVVRRLLPFQVELFSHPVQRRDVRARVAAGEYDIVYTYYFRSAEITRGLGPPDAGRPVTFLTMQLSQTLNTRRIAKNAPNVLCKLFYSLESCLVARYEARIWSEFTRSILIGHRDVVEIEKSCRAHERPSIDNYVFGAHGTDVGRFVPRIDIPEKPAHLVFTGVMRTPTNVQAVLWFAHHVWPAVRAAMPAATWSIVGREPSKEVLDLSTLPDVTVTGTVPDPSVCIAEATVCINPMQAGGGMQNKLLEYLASAKPVVATSVANEGIGANPGTHLLVANDPREFAASIVTLLTNCSKRIELGRAAREFVLANWTWERHWLELERNFYLAIDQEDRLRVRQFQHEGAESSTAVPAK